MALKCGVDLVLELPTIYSISSAENFAYGATKILDSLNLVDYLCFGSECGDISILDDIVQVLVEEPKAYRTLLSHELSTGVSFPKARENALMMYLGNMRRFANVLSSPNNILGIEYLKALKKQDSFIQPVTIKRQEAEHNNNMFSSSSRFAKVAFTKLHSVSGDSENESVNQFFHILGSVDQQRGCCDVNGKYEITLYTSCCNTQKGIYYYTTYDNHQISAVDMTKEDLNTKNLICYEVITGEHIQMQN